MERYSGTEPTALLLWDAGTQIEVTGNKLVELLMKSRNEFAYQVRDALSALERHGVKYDVNAMPLPDQIDLLAGKLAARRR